MSEELIKEFRQVSSLLNFAHPTSFVLDIPVKSVGIGTNLEKIGYNEKRFAMNVVNFTVNRLELKPNTVSKRDFELNYPSGTEQGTKMFTVNYKLSSGWQQYAFLARWWQRNLKVLKHIEDEDLTDEFENSGEYIMFPVRFWALDENKDPCMLITYEDCWLQELGEMQVSYSDTNPTLSHSFSCYYNNFVITILNEALKNV